MDGNPAACMPSGVKRGNFLQLIVEKTLVGFYSHCRKGYKIHAQIVISLWFVTSRVSQHELLVDLLLPVGFAPLQLPVHYVASCNHTHSVTQSKSINEFWPMRLDYNPNQFWDGFRTPWLLCWASWRRRASSSLSDSLHSHPPPNVTPHRLRLLPSSSNIFSSITYCKLARDKGVC